jgi:hypothetical protein
METQAYNSINQCDHAFSKPDLLLSVYQKRGFIGVAITTTTVIHHQHRHYYCYNFTVFISIIHVT